MNLKHLTDQVLLEDIKLIAAKERKATVELLYHLKEVDRRKLYSEMKYPNLYEYCVRELGYSEASAQRRITSARLLKDLPQISKKIEQGSLTLSNISQASRFFKEKNLKDPAKQTAILSQLENLSSRECAKKLHELKGNKRPMTVTIVITSETFELIEDAKKLAHKSLDVFLKEAVEAYKKQFETKKFKTDSKEKNLPPTSEVKRVIPSYLKKIVYRRDKKCQKCGSKNNLQFDHRIPFSDGGKTNAENLRLLCANCNQRSRVNYRLGGLSRL